MSSTTHVTVFGRKYTLQSDSGMDLALLAQMVDERMRVLRQQGGGDQAVDLAILTAMQLAEDLANSQESDAPVQAPPEVEDRLNRLLLLLDDVPDGIETA